MTWVLVSFIFYTSYFEKEAMIVSQHASYDACVAARGDMTDRFKSSSTITVSYMCYTPDVAIFTVKEFNKK